MADAMRIYFKRDETFQKELKLLEQESISARNKELIFLAIKTSVLS